MNYEINTMYKVTSKQANFSYVDWGIKYFQDWKKDKRTLARFYILWSYYVRPVFIATDGQC